MFQPDETALVNVIPRDDITESNNFHVSSTPTGRPLTEREARVLRYSNYQRHPKPPYSYLGMIVYAIQSTPEKRLTLAQIKDRMSEMFEFFRGEYDGWKDSVRHNLSHNACFVKASVQHDSKQKGGLWTVDLTKVPSNAFKRQETTVAKQGHWATDLHVQLGIPEIHIPTQVQLTTDGHDDESTSSDTLSTCSSFVPSPFSDAGSYTTHASSPRDFMVDEWNEHRRNSPFLSDSSFDSTPTSQGVGPVRLRRNIAKNNRRSKLMNERNKERLMKLITECAEQANISHDDAIHNLSQLCMSVDLSMPDHQPSPAPSPVTSVQSWSPYYHPSQMTSPYPQAAYYPYVYPSHPMTEMPRLPAVRYSPPELTAPHDVINTVSPPDVDATWSLALQNQPAAMDLTISGNDVTSTPCAHTPSGVPAVKHEADTIYSEL